VVLVTSTHIEAPEKPDVLKPDVLKPDVLKPDVLWVYSCLGLPLLFQS
jgi:hypothetical protein